MQRETSVATSPVGIGISISLLAGKFKNNVRLKEQAAKRSLAVNYQMNVPGYSETMARIALVSRHND